MHTFRAVLDVECLPELVEECAQDAAAFAAGERAALARAFQAALPGQQALGRLAAAAEAQGRGLAEEGERVRALQGDSAEFRATVQVMPAAVRAMCPRNNACRTSCPSTRSLHAPGACTGDDGSVLPAVTSGSHTANQVG